MIYVFVSVIGETRSKRQLNLICSDGTRAVSSCINGGCGTSFFYRCDTTRNYCCPIISTFGTMPLCSDGNQSIAACLNGVCSNGYSCQTASTGQRVCCRVVANFGINSFWKRQGKNVWIKVQSLISSLSRQCSYHWTLQFIRTMHKSNQQLYLH